MRFNDLLRMAGIAPETVAVMLHTPAQPALRRMLPALAESEPDLFDAYQNTHSRNAEATLKGRKVCASFANTRNADFLFLGLFEVAGCRFQTLAELDGDQSRRELLVRFPDETFTAFGTRTGIMGRDVFKLVPLPELAGLRGRLLVEKPAKAGQAYVRLAETCHLPVLEMTREAHFAPPAPDWDAFVVTAAEVRALPAAWQARLREWRGIYLIVDEADGARYVGSAYGADNLMGRWRTHVSSEKGVTVELEKRDPASFRFSILELIAPTALPDQVIAAEQAWKLRLHTITHGLNRN